MSRELFNSYRRSRMRKFETGGDIKPLDENGNERAMPVLSENRKGTIEELQDNEGWYQGKIIKRGIHNNKLGLTDRGQLSDWYTSNMDKPNFGYNNFEDFKADWPTAELDGGVAITGEGGPEYFMGQERKPEKLIKLPSRSIEQIPTPEMGGPKRLPPFELMKNNSSHFTIQRQGLHSGTYTKGEDGLALMVLKDQAGRVVWKGSQTEYEKNYGDFLEKGDTEYGERKKHRLYLKKYGGTINPILMDMHRHNYGGHTNWNKRAKAEYGKTVEQPVDKRALRDNVSLIQPTPIDSVSTPALTVDTVEQELNKPVKEEVNSLTVNKHGWADLEAYRKKKDDTDFIMGTQDFLIENGWKGSNDGAFGNKTYAGMNEYLTNRKLDEYSSDNFTEDQFYDQIYKESHGKNDKVSPRGAIGLAQFMPSTFTWAKEKGWIPETAKISDPAAQSLAQRKYMDHLYNDIAVVKSAGTDREERQARAFASYNHGPDNFKNFWEGLTTKQKDEGWKTWYKEANDETQKYVLWMMDKAEYKRLYNTPETRTRKDGTTFKTSKWNDVYYGYESWRSKNHSYRY